MANSIGSRKEEASRRLKFVGVVAVSVALVGGTGWYAALHHPGLSWRLQQFIQGAASLLPWGIGQRGLAASSEDTRLAGDLEGLSTEDGLSEEGASRSLASRRGWSGSEGSSGSEASLGKAKKGSKEASGSARLAALKAKARRGSRDKDARSGPAALDRSEGRSDARSARALAGSSKNSYSNVWEIGPGGYPYVVLKGKKVPVVRPDGKPGNPNFPVIEEFPEERKLPLGALAFVTSIEADGNDQKRTILDSNGSRVTYEANKGGVHGATLAQCHEAVIVPHAVGHADEAKGRGILATVEDVLPAEGGVNIRLNTGKAVETFGCAAEAPCAKWLPGQPVVLEPQAFGAFYEVTNITRNPDGSTRITLTYNGNGNTNKQVTLTCPADAVTCQSWTEQNNAESHALMVPKELYPGPSNEPVLAASIRTVDNRANGQLLTYTNGTQFFAVPGNVMYNRYTAGQRTEGLTFDMQCRQATVTQRIQTEVDGKRAVVLAFNDGFRMTCTEDQYCFKFQVGQNVVVDARITGGNVTGGGAGN